ncbi:MAG: transglycosylase SLT domain-containing protein [Bacteroidales bacterium]|jgi:hypothetical protein|nr:transglycosylase SLT domain-containing protein [Bacteroidales bacterium]
MKLIQEFTDKITGPDKLSFLKKLVAISRKLKINPNWLLAVMNSESGINAQAVNQNGGATGLIQFMPATAEWLGTSTSTLYRMSRVQQLDYVYKYYQKWLQSGKQIKSYEDLYMLTFYPYATNQGNSYVFGSERSSDYAKIVSDHNPGMDLSKDGLITKAEFKQWIYKNKIKGRISKKSQKLLDPNNRNRILLAFGIGALAIAGGAFVYDKFRR